MKLLHTSDWHLGITHQGGWSFREDQEFMINEICRIAVEQKVDGILLAGDVYDRSIASQEAIQLYDSAMTHICGELGIPVYMVAGNHDGSERLAACNELLKKSGLYIAGSLKKEPQVISREDVDIWLLPWISTDKVKAMYPEQADEVENMEDAYRVVLDSYRALFTPGKKNILVNHAYIANAERSGSDHSAELGNASMVDAGLFEGFDYVALGHIHGQQKIRDFMYYSGAPMKFSFGKEEKQDKVVLLLDTDTMQVTPIAPGQLHERNTLSGTLEELLTKDYPEAVRRGYVRIEVTDAFASLEVQAALRERFPRMLDCDGKHFERDDAKITMSLEDLEKAQEKPELIFRQFCMDIMGEEPDEHQMELFQAALMQYGKGVEEQ